MATKGERWLLAGLGNPVDEYPGTRHNIGADVVRALVARHDGALRRVRKARGAAAELELAERRIVAFVPGGYMNLAGGPVQAASAWYKVDVSRLIVCHDDLDLDLGTLRCKRGGGNAGHNGLKDVDRAMGSRDYVRIRIGIGRPAGPMPPRAYVLQRFTPGEQPQVEAAVERAVDMIASVIVEGVEATQNRFHG